jgi:hypothetical protein
MGSAGRERERETVPVPYAGNEGKGSKWWSPSPRLISDGWGDACGQMQCSGWLRWLLTQGGNILTRTIGVLQKVPSLLSTHPRILAAF